MRAAEDFGTSEADTEDTEDKDVEDEEAEEESEAESEEEEHVLVRDNNSSLLVPGHWCSWS